MCVDPVDSDEASGEGEEVGSRPPAPSPRRRHGHLSHRGECADHHSNGAQQLSPICVARRRATAARESLHEEGAPRLLAGVLLRGHGCLFPLPSVDMSPSRLLLFVRQTQHSTSK